MPHARTLSASLLLGLIACSGTEPSGSAPPGTEIVFQSSDSTDSDIYVVNADGSGLTRLTAYPDADVAPTWSGDGRQIYFLSYNRDDRKTLDLYAMNGDASDVHLVADSIYLGFSAYRPSHRPYAVSPDGTRIALGASTPLQFPQNLDLFVINVDGSDRTPILDLPCDEYYTHCEYLTALAWSPDGQRIAYSACFGGHGSFGCNIGVVNAGGTGQRALASVAANTTEPAWAPDGQRIVFSSGGTRSSLEYPLNLEIINADGTGRMVLLDGSMQWQANSSPSWSPNGQSLVFAQFQPNWMSPVPEQSDLFAINVDGTGLRRVLTVPGGAFAPDWNPTGPDLGNGK
jgi:TolB protein